MDRLTKIAITMGDPAGIGPEVVAKALAAYPEGYGARLVVVGNYLVMEKASKDIGSSLRLKKITTPDDFNQLLPTEYGIIDDGDSDLVNHPMGTVSATAGESSIRWVKDAAYLALEGSVDAIVTGPINKTSAHEAGYAEVGHMEIFQEMSKSAQVATMLMTTDLNVVHLTTHKPLSEAHFHLTIDNIFAKILLTHDFFEKYNFGPPRIGVAAYNPHGGESGILGSEEIESISPAIIKAQDIGILAFGPIPADSIFTKAIEGEFDVVLAMYHDQGHIAVKVHGWEQSVTINLGLPFLRTSVDHGTAFDIAGKGVANPAGMISAIKAAVRVSSQNGLGVE